MSTIDATWLDGSQTQSGLTDACATAAGVTQISLIAKATDGFLVVQGSDAGRETFDDADDTHLDIILPPAHHAHAKKHVERLESSLK